MSATTSLCRVAGIDFHVEQSGSGEPLVLIHGGWGSTARWSLIADGLAQSFHLFAYDRRGHGRSGNGTVPPTRIDQEDDLAGLIEQLGIAPAHLVGSSFGGSIALSLAARRPELVRSVCVHEPPLTGFAADDPHVIRVMDDIQELAALIDRGEREEAARGFVERVAFGPGSWPMLPAELQQQMISHADSFADEQRDREWATARLEDIECPVLVTDGDQSPAWFAPVTAAVTAAIPHATGVTIAGSGHIPHITHADEYVDMLTRFAEG